MAAQIQLGDIEVDVVLKDIKNVHLSVYPPTGHVRISAPSHMSLETIRLYAISKLEWIKKQQAELRAQERETPRDYIERESHYVWGKRYLLKVVEANRAQSVTLEGNKMALQIRPETGQDKRQEIVEAFYREQIRAEAPMMIAGWEKRMDVAVDRFYVQRMKTRWGSCNPEKHSIRLNTELAKKPRECLDYLIAHEMAHLLEPTHNTHFVALMDQFMPNWRDRRDQLNQLPVRHETWRY
ncbi:MAG: M48 family metallopeptidase [Anaerolineales bacterium]|nr:M48 family metallopeptidase [Anaerolineales bacterium]